MRKKIRKNETTNLEKIRNKLFHYFDKSRLGGWTIASAFVLLGEWYSFKSFPIVSTIIVLLATIGITSAGSWINWVYDRKLDKFAGKKIDFFSKYISPKEMFLVSITISILCLILLIFVNLSIFVLGVLMFIIFFIYSAPPLRIKSKPPLDLLANLLVFGTLPFLIGWMIAKNAINITTIYYAIIAGLVITSYYLILSSFDIEKDKKFGINTTCTKLGKQKSVNVGIILFFITLFIAIISLGPYSILTIAMIVTAPFFGAMIIKNDQRSLRILLGSAYYFSAESLLLLLIFYSRSIIPAAFFIFMLVIGFYAVFYIILYKKGIS